MDWHEAWRRAGAPHRDDEALAYLAQNTDQLPGVVYFEIDPLALEVNPIAQVATKVSHPMCRHRWLMAPTARQGGLVAMEPVVVAPQKPLHIGAWGGGNDGAIVVLSVEGDNLVQTLTWGDHTTSVPLTRLESGLRPHVIETEWQIDGVLLHVPHAVVTAVNLSSRDVTLAVDRYSRPIYRPVVRVC